MRYHALRREKSNPLFFHFHSSPQAPAVLRSHFKHNVFMLDEAGDLLEHLGAMEDYLLAAELYEAALKRWPMARIQMRQGARRVRASLGRNKWVALIYFSRQS